MNSFYTLNAGIFGIINREKLPELILFAGAFLIAAIIGYFIIPVLRRLKFGQSERADGPESHLHKQGTPTMGGVIFLVPIVVFSVVAYFVWSMEQILPLAFVTIGFGFVGFLDDWLKVVKKNTKGLSPMKKMAGLLVVSLLFCLYLEFFTEIDNTIKFALFGLNLALDLTWLYIPFTIFVLLATTNGSNLTDGVDGLCGGVTFIIMMFFAVANPTGDISAFAVLCAGALLGFLLYNKNPAKVFMGDTGSLALGGGVAACAIMMQRPFLILLIGIIYVAEALSVMIQVGYYKKTKKRIFRMAPLHHHYELGGWSEKKVVWVFWGVTVLACVLAYMSLNLKLF